MKTGRLWELVIIPISEENSKCDEVTIENWKLAEQIPIQIFAEVKNKFVKIPKRKNAVVIGKQNSQKLRKILINIYQNYLQQLTNEELIEEYKMKKIELSSMKNGPVFLV